MKKLLLIILMLSIATVACEKQITNFEECVKAGNAVMESYPRQCAANGQNFVEDIKHICTDEEKAAEMCTMEYMPVCGDDGITYGNKCSACSSKNIDSYVPGECPDKTYVTRDLEQCKVIKYMCVKGKVYFSDEFGCGCEPEKDQLCGNGVCDSGEADACPACYNSTPPCLAPCTKGTCPEDCNAAAKEPNVTECSTEQTTTACTKEYIPVCGKFILNTGNVAYETFGNGCSACAAMKVVSYTPGECPVNDKKYSSKSAEECSRMGVWQCDEGYNIFSDETGCGCAPIILIGGQKDEHGCLGPAGYSWNESVGACIREWELDESQRQAAKIAVMPLDSVFTVTKVLTLRCPGCFDVYLKNNMGDTDFPVKLRNWTITEE